MSRDEAMAVLQEESRETAIGLTWLAPPALRDLTWSQGIESDAEALEAVATALGCDMAFVPAGQPWAAEAAKRLQAADIAVAWAVAGVLSRVADSEGWMEALRRSAAEPATMAAKLDEALNETLMSVREGADAGVDVMVIADDLAGPSGWLLSPDYAMDTLMSYYRKAAGEAKRRGIAAVFHSDGDVRALFPSLARAGFDGVHLGGAGREAIEASMPVAVRENLALLGGVSVQALGVEGARHLGERLARLGTAGRLIICDDGGLTAADEVAAVASVFDAVRQFTERGTGGRQV